MSGDDRLEADEDEYRSETRRPGTLFELRSHKINIYLLNEGNEYIEDASIQLEIGRRPGLLIADEIIEAPQKTVPFMALPRLPSIHDDPYPYVEQGDDKINVFQEIGDIKQIGDIKHHLVTEAFNEPIRVVLLEGAKGAIT